MKITKSWIQQTCFEEILPLWKSMPETFPDFLYVYGEEEKAENEEHFKQHIELLKKEFSLFPEEEGERPAWKAGIDRLILAFVSGERILNISGSMGRELFLDFEREAKQFIRRARSFDSELNMDSIWQGMRNYFIYAMITDLQDQKQNCSDPIFAYSLLYPYTDNYIDSHLRSRAEKEQYNRLIKAVLRGEACSPSNPLEEKTVRLLHMLLGFYQKEKKAEVADLLLLMLEAQEMSIIQQKRPGFGKKDQLSGEDILRISAYKGGISVLNDYIFGVAMPKKEEVIFYLKFGLILQFADDLQDIAEDEKEHSRTIMTGAAKSGNLEAKVNKLLHFIRCVMDEFEPRNAGLKEFSVKNCILMTLAETISNRKYFSGNYLKRIEQHLPFHPAFLEEMSKQQRRPGMQISAGARQMEILDVMVSG